MPTLYLFLPRVSVFWGFIAMRDRILCKGLRTTRNRDIQAPGSQAIVKEHPSSLRGSAPCFLLALISTAEAVPYKQNFARMQ